MPGGSFGQLPRIPQAAKAEHGHNGGVIGIVPLREDGVIFCGEEFIVEKTLSVMVSLPGKGVQQDVGGGLLDILPVGGVPQRRQRRGGIGGPELRLHGLGDVVHQCKQPSGLLRCGLHPQRLQRKAVQKHIAAHGKSPAAHREQAQAAAVVKGAAADDLYAVRQGGFFQKAAAHRVQFLFVRGRGVKVKIVPAGGLLPHRLPERPGQPHRTVCAYCVAAEGIRRRQAAGLFREAVVAQLGQGKAAALRGGQSARQRHAGRCAVHPHQPCCICRKGQDIQYQFVCLFHHAATSFFCIHSAFSIPRTGGDCPVQRKI